MLIDICLTEAEITSGLSVALDKLEAEKTLKARLEYENRKGSEEWASVRANIAALEGLTEKLQSTEDAIKRQSHD